MMHLIGNHEMVYPNDVRDSKYHMRPNVATAATMDEVTKANRMDDSVSKMIEG